jgi:hypothetical protein
MTSRIALDATPEPQRAREGRLADRMEHRMRALGLALMLLAIPIAGAGRQQQEPTDSGTPDSAELPADRAEAGPEDRLGFLLTLTVSPGENVRDAICLLCPTLRPRAREGGGPEAAGLTRNAPRDDERNRPG